MNNVTQTEATPTALRVSTGSRERGQRLVAYRDCWNCLSAVELPERGHLEQCPHCGVFGPHGEAPENTKISNAGTNT